MSCSCGPFETCPTCSPPPDPVAALADALCYEIPHSRAFCPVIDEDRARRLLTRLTAAGWSLSHDSERRSAVIGSERSDNEALVAALEALEDLERHHRMDSYGMRGDCEMANESAINAVYAIRAAIGGR